MTRTLIKNLLARDGEREKVEIKGWVRTRRDSKKFSFIEINDGSCLANIQVIVDETLPDYAKIKNLSTGSSIAVAGKLVSSGGREQKWELVADNVHIYGLADETYPLQKKGHSLEFLREIAHLRPRTNLFGCVFRIRSRLAFAIHRFFQEKDFVYVHTPIITASDCEGAGELFKITTLDMDAVPAKNGKADYDKDFFGKPAYLTVSGQLEGELMATALSNIYTFGPTFRAENSNTVRHASEFWMVEPEMAFCDLPANMDLAEEFIKYLIRDVIDRCGDDLQLFTKFIDKGLMDRLTFVLNRPFKRILYTDAVVILVASGKKFDYPPSFGVNLQTEHERYLSEDHFKCPVIIFDYPREIKPFYMRANDDEKTVAAMDIIVPGIGEIIGGSQREERLERLTDNMERLGINRREYWWYIDTRRYGTVPHSGFGLGFDRMMMFITGMSNIRDITPFARTPKNAEF